MEHCQAIRDPRMNNRLEQTHSGVSAGPDPRVHRSVHQQLGQILDPKDTKRSKYQLLLLRGLEQKLRVGCKSRVLHMTPALNST